MTSEEQIEVIKEAQKKYYPGREVWHRETGEKHVVLYPFLDSRHRLCLRSVGWKDLLGAKNWITTPPLPDGHYLVISRKHPVPVLKDRGYFYRFIPPGTRTGFYTVQDDDDLYRIVPDGDTIKFEKVELPEGEDQ